MLGTDLPGSSLAEASSREIPGMAELTKIMTEMVRQNQQMLIAITAKEMGIKQVVDTEWTYDPSQAPPPPPAPAPTTKKKPAAKQPAPQN